MGLDADLLEMLPHTANLGRLGTDDVHGNNTYRGGGSIRCFISDESEGVPGGEQQERKPAMPGTTFSLLTDAEDIKLGDRLTIGTKTAYVTSARTYRDETGKLYQEIEASTEREI